MCASATNYDLKNSLQAMVMFSHDRKSRLHGSSALFPVGITITAASRQGDHAASVYIHCINAGT